MEASDFIIKEFRGKFEIQKKCEIKKGFFWNRKTEIIYKPIDVNGNTVFFATIGSITYTNQHLRNPKYDSLNSAKEALNGILKGTIIHTV